MSGSRQRFGIACIVADHWRRAALDWGDQMMEGRVTAHPLCMVRTALDGETDPALLGVDGIDAEQIRRIAKGAPTQETITAAPIFEPIPAAWWCLTHDHPARNSRECNWGTFDGGRCRLAPVYVQTEDT